jgi:hypothetical protein
MAALTAEQIAELETKYGEIAEGKIAHCKGKAGKDGSPSWEIVFRRPLRMHYKQWRKMINDPVGKPEAAEFLVKNCIVHPDKKGFEELLNEHPGICESSAVQKAIIALTSMESEEGEKE